MPKWVLDLLHLIRHPRLAAVVAILTGLLLFLPIDALKYFGLDSFAQSYRGIISLFFGGSVILLATYPIEFMYKGVVSQIQHFRYKAKIKEYIQNAGADEVQILLKFAETRKNTVFVPHDDMAVAEGLIQKRLLYRNIQVPSGGWDYTLTSEASALIHSKEFQELLLKNSQKEASKREE